MKNQNLSVLDKNKGAWMNRLVIGTPMTGLVRAEWIFSRYGQVIPTNWSQADVFQFMSSYIPLEYQIADAENLIAKAVVEKNAEWLLFIEHDNIMPPNTFVKFNEYMIEGKIPVVGSLYFTKSVPPEPMVYREKGWGYFDKWKMGDKVWVKGLPFGCTLIHGSIIKALWDESPEYNCNGVITRRVFETPARAWLDPETKGWMSECGTSDLHFFNRIIKDNILAKAGWPEFQKKAHPFLIDTSIFVRHIDNAGVQWPLEVPRKFLPSPGLPPQEIL